MKKTWKVLLCMALIMTMLLGSVAMAAGVPSPADQAAADNHHAIAGLEGLNNGRDLGGYVTADGIRSSPACCCARRSSPTARRATLRCWRPWA